MPNEMDNLDESAEEAGALYNQWTYNLPNLFQNYLQVRSDTDEIIKDRYEKPYNYYYLTFKPFNSFKTNETKKHLMHCNYFIEHALKKVLRHDIVAYIATREILSTTPHINLIVVSKNDITKLHDKQTNLCKIYCKKISDTKYDLLKCYSYIIKESKERRFTKHIDYIAHRNH